MSSGGHRTRACQGSRWCPSSPHSVRLAFSDVVILLRGLDEVGNKAFAEWVIEADHTGTFRPRRGCVLEATGRRVQLAGVTVADFRGGDLVIPVVL